MMIDFNKPVRTKSGEPVEIITTEGRGRYPIVGFAGNNEIPSIWTADGQIAVNVKSSGDLENVPQKRSGWKTVRRDPDFGLLYGKSTHETIEEAIAMLDSYWHGVIKGEWPE